MATELLPFMPPPCGCAVGVTDAQAVVGMPKDAFEGTAGVTAVYLTRPVAAPSLYLNGVRVAEGRCGPPETLPEIPGFEFYPVTLFEELGRRPLPLHLLDPERTDVAFGWDIDDTGLRGPLWRAFGVRETASVPGMLWRALRADRDGREPAPVTLRLTDGRGWRVGLAFADGTVGPRPGTAWE